MIEVTISTLNTIQVVTLTGDLDASTTPVVVEKVQPLTSVESLIVIDMSKVAYMSSAGLRMLLTVYRTISAKGGKVVLIGLSTELEDTMSMTGFLDFFEHYINLQEGMSAIATGN